MSHTVACVTCMCHDTYLHWPYTAALAIYGCIGHIRLHGLLIHAPDTRMGHSCWALVFNRMHA